MVLKRNAGILSILSLLIAGSPIILAAYSPFIADNMFPIFFTFIALSLFLAFYAKKGSSKRIATTLVFGFIGLAALLYLGMHLFWSKP
ncbi:hypothetical protein IHV10_09980 [Fictibacillus sp. 5RED26]|jgi:hypothetical protein|uniref:hypothetical protein n=1 Tax=Fictibacillus sp. 5RED26 TaxID=2745876 RepID=UPI0018CF1555|nr:hypothetical protein [Fictibacillus sp. 5RED26]MBH0156695.1 hypothetical protein [Fictibacillus sp. 5RED26]